MNKKGQVFSDYSLDIDAIVEYCKEKISQNMGKIKKDYRQSEITNTYELLDDSDDLALTQKIVHEVITPQDEVQYDELKSTIVKALLAKFLTVNSQSISHDDNDVVDISGLVAMQTLIDYDFLIKIKE